MTSRSEPLVSGLHHRLAAQLIEQLRQGDAPWQRPVRSNSRLPYNPHNKRRFHSVNLVALLAQSREDPRWMTQQQAARLGGQVRPDERGTLMHCWQFSEQQPGQEARALTHPRLATAVVFNAEQIDGLEPMPAPQTDHLDGYRQVEQLVRASGATIVYTEKSAHYEVGSDTLHLPPRASILPEPAQAARSLRALARWGSHKQRLGYELRAPIGSMAAAAEELHLAIYVMLCAHDFGLAIPRTPRIEMCDAWVSLLERDPLVLGRAATDAERVRAFLLQGNYQEQRREALVSRNRGTAEVRSMDEKPKQYLAVPYVDRHRAGALGARWDSVAKCMYIGQNGDPDALAQWLPSQSNMPRSSNAREEFAEVLRNLGLEVTGAHPIMDGRRHRLKAEGDRGRETAGYYVGRLDGIPNGFAGNYRTGQQTPWSARGLARSPEELAELRAQAAQAAADRAEARRKLERLVAERVQARIPDLQPLRQSSPYLVRKNIIPTPGALVVSKLNGRDPDWWPFTGWPCRHGTICLPARDARGRLWTMQYIDPDGAKRFEPNGFKRGCFHLIGARELGSASSFVIAEGYATAATIHELLKDPSVAVIAGFDSGNLLAVASGLHAAFPLKPIVVAGDNDQRLLHRPPHINVGLEKATAAAAAVRGVAITPMFPRDSEPSLTDFNDLASFGASYRSAIARQLRGALALAKQQLHSIIVERQRTLSRGARS